MTGDEKPNSLAAEPVGQQLRQAREKAGLSVSAVADQQHLRVSVIQAIENGDYEKIDTELFLKGYVRAYARQVGLDADAIIRDLETELEPRRKEREQAQQASPLVCIERRLRQKRRAAKLGLILLIAAAFGLLAYFYLAGNDTGPLPAAQDTEQSIFDESPGLSVEEPPTEPGQAAEMAAEREPTLVLPEDDMDVESEQPQGDTVFESEPPQAGVVEPTQAPVEPAVAVNEIPGPARLQMTFRDDCWVRVTDATGTRLANGLSAGGSQLDVSGEGPLRVVIGAMSAVESIRFRGETLAPGSFLAVNNRAEFTLEP